MKFKMCLNIPPSRSIKQCCFNESRTMGIEPLNNLANFESGYLVNVSNELVYIVPPTSMCTGAVYRLAAATHGMPVIGLWLACKQEAALAADPEVLPDPLVTPEPTVPGGSPSGVMDELAGGVGVGELEFEIVGETVGEALQKQINSPHLDVAPEGILL